MEKSEEIEEIDLPPESLQRRARTWALRLLPAVACLVAGTAVAEIQPIVVELNKLEMQDGKCRAFVVVTNGSDVAYKTLKLDLVVFRTDGVIGRRFAIDLGPIKPQKRSVKLFDVESTPCEQIGSLLVNDVLDCATEAGPATDCLGAMSLSSLSSVKLSK